MDALSCTASDSAFTARFWSIPRALGTEFKMLIRNSSAIWEDSLRFSLLASARRLGRLRFEYPARSALLTPSPVLTYSWMKVFCLWVVCVFHFWANWLLVFKFKHSLGGSGKQWCDHNWLIHFYRFTVLISMEILDIFSDMSWWALLLLVYPFWVILNLITPKLGLPCLWTVAFTLRFLAHKLNNKQIRS